MPPALGLVLTIFFVAMLIFVWITLNRSAKKATGPPVEDNTLKGQKIKVIKTLYSLAYNLDKKVMFVQVEKFKVIDNMNMVPDRFKRTVQLLVVEDIVTEPTEDTIAFTEFGLKYYGNIVIGK